MSVAPYRQKLFIVCYSLFVLIVISACYDDERHGFVCDLHDMEEAMPGLAAFRGEDAGNQISESIQLYREAIDQGRIGEAEGYFCLGELLLLANQPHEALVKFDESISRDDVPYQHFFARGRTFIELGDCANGLLDLDLVLSKGADGFAVHMAKAQASVDCGHFSEAIDALDAASAEIRGSTRPLQWILVKAEALTGLGDYEQAVLFTEKYVVRMSELGNCLPVMSRCINPRLIEGVNVQLDLLCRIGDFEQAREVYSLYGKYQKPSPVWPNCLD